MMAKRNAIAAITALITSSANFVILICLNGHERGLVASSVSALSLTIICMVIHWGMLRMMISCQLMSTHIFTIVTTHPAELRLNERALQRVNGDKPVRLEIKQHQEVVILTELNNHV